MNSDFDIHQQQLEVVLRQANRLARPPREKTIFSIGAKAYYENPTSDVLAFFLDPHEAHGFGSLFLQALFDATRTPYCDFESLEKSKREVLTQDFKRIDILLTNETDVILIENKIRHWAANPFESYESFTDNFHQGKRKFLFLLSPRNEVAPERWIAINYTAFIAELKLLFGSYLFSTQYSKWVVLLREFILNIENECESDQMEEKEFEFVTANYQSMYRLQKMGERYIAEIERRGIEAVKSVSQSLDTRIFTKVHDWSGDRKALRFISSIWGTYTNITVALKPDGTYALYVYVYNIPDDESERLKSFISNAKLSRFWTEQKTIRCFGEYNCSDLNDALDEIQNTSKRLNAYFSELPC